jgi:hypothetical protein
VQRRDLVVELFAALVEAASAAGRDLTHLFERDRRAAITLRREIRRDFEHAERAPRVAVTAVRERDERFVVDGELPLAETPLCVLERATEQLDEILRLQRTEHVNTRAGQQRADHFERRILGGRADEGQRAVFDVGQEGVLLCLVEAVHLVEEQDRASTSLGAHGLRSIDGLTDILHTRHHGGELHEFGVGTPRDEPRERRLPRAGRSPENQRMQLSALERFTQRLAGPEYLLLADELVEGARTHAIRERSQPIVQRDLLEKIRLRPGRLRAARAHCAVLRPKIHAATCGQRSSPARASSNPRPAPSRLAMQSITSASRPTCMTDCDTSIAAPNRNWNNRIFHQPRRSTSPAK